MTGGGGGHELELLENLEAMQVDIPESISEDRTARQIIERRLQRTEQLIGIYQKQIWESARELRVKRQKFTDDCVWKDGARPSISKLADISQCFDAHEGNFQMLYEGCAASCKPPHFEKIEDLCLALHQYSKLKVDESESLKSKMMFVERLGLVSRLEESALASTCHDLDHHAAIGALHSRHSRFLLRKSAVVLGRSTELRGSVDIDLSGEVGGQTVSRRQAQLYLDCTGQFLLRSTGRRSMSVNGEIIMQGQSTCLPHLSLLKIGGVQLMFLINRAAVERTLRRSKGMNI